MTGDAQAEAERICEELLRSATAVGVVQALAGMESDPEVARRRQGQLNSRLSEATEVVNDVVAALAAAIEVAEDGAPVVNDYTDEAVVQCKHEVWLRLCAALSALRARTGEET